MPIGFSHAPAAKRRLMRSGIPYITIEGTLGGGLNAAVALNALADSLLEARLSLFSAKAKISPD